MARQRIWRSGYAPIRIFERITPTGSKAAGGENPVEEQGWTVARRSSSREASRGAKRNGIVDMDPSPIHSRRERLWIPRGRPPAGGPDRSGTRPGVRRLAPERLSKERSHNRFRACRRTIGVFGPEPHLSQACIRTRGQKRTGIGPRQPPPRRQPSPGDGSRLQTGAPPKERIVRAGLFDAYAVISRRIRLLRPWRAVPPQKNRDGSAALYAEPSRGTWGLNESGRSDSRPLIMRAE